MVLKTGVSVCLRPNPLPETTRAVTLHGEGSFGFPAVTETTGRRLPSEASPSGGRETKTRRKFSQGSGGLGARSSPWPAQWRRDGHGERTGSYPRRVPDILARIGRPKMEPRPAGLPKGPEHPEGLTQEPSFWTPFPWPRTSGSRSTPGATAAFCQTEGEHCRVPTLG